LADPDVVISDFLGFFGVEVFSPTGGVAPFDVSSIADFDVLAFDAFWPAATGAAASFDTASAAAFFDFLAFEVFSACVSWVVCASAGDCNMAKPQNQTAQVAIPWQKSVNFLHCIG
jgi:hypothetical protein